MLFGSAAPAGSSGSVHLSRTNEHRDVQNVGMLKMVVGKEHWHDGSAGCYLSHK